MIAAYHQPKVLAVALDHVAKGATPIAGATGLYTGKGKSKAELVDVTRLGLDEIEVFKSSVKLGAMMTLEQLAGAVDIPGTAGAVLRQVSQVVASAPLRNAITLGGNLAHLVYWADMPVALLALDAVVQVHRAGSEPTTVAIDELLASGKKAWAGGLITSIEVPLMEQLGGFGYERFTRTASDYAFASTCVTLHIKDGKAADVRIAIGAVQTRPGRLLNVEALVEGKAWDADLRGEVEEKVKTTLKVAPNFRAPASYRRQLAAVLVGRAMETAWSCASREDG